MCRCKVDLSLEGSTAVDPVVRLWVDDGAGELSEREVELKRSSETDWTAGFDAPDDGAPIWFRLGLAAEPGTEWYFVVRTEDAREVLRDGDVLTLPKEWVVGTCSV